MRSIKSLLLGFILPFIQVSYPNFVYCNQRVAIDTISYKSNMLIYILPDSLETFYSELMEAYNYEIKDVFFVICSSDTDNSVGLCLIDDSILRELKLEVLKSSTNRFIIIRNRCIPILFETDFFFTDNDFGDIIPNPRILISQIIIDSKKRGTYKEIVFS